MIVGPKTVLLADDEPAVLALYRHGLPLHLPGFEFATVTDGAEAIAYLSSRPVTVLVTDIAMPGRDGFEVLAFVRNHHPNLPVVVLSGMAPQQVFQGRTPLGAMHVLQKPVAPAKLAEHIVAAQADNARGKVTGVPLATLLQLVQAERRSCALHLQLGERRGRLHFLGGELVNAYAFELDAEGEAAARHLLSWDAAAVEFERSLHNHVRTIHTPLTRLLLDVLRQADEARRHGAAEGAGGGAIGAAAGGAIAARPRPAQGNAPIGVATDPPADRTAPGPLRAAPEGPRVAGPGTLEHATATLLQALGDLRRAAAGTAERLERAAPAVGAGLRAARTAAAARSRDREAEARFARARQEVAALAVRLAAAAGGGAPATDRRG